MDILQKELDRRIDELEQAAEFRQRLDNLVSFYPFNEYEYMISVLINDLVGGLRSYEAIS